MKTPRHTHTSTLPGDALAQVSLGRRSVLLGGLSLLGGAAVAPVASAARGLGLAQGSRGARNLVLLQLSGGNDGLSTVVPHGDDAYHAARRAARVAPEEVLRLDDYRGLHPELRRLRRLWDAGRVALVEGAGYPAPNRSHFKSLEIWHTGRAEGRASGEGWVGRLCAAAFADERSPELVCHVGADVPYALSSSAHPPVAFATPSGYRWVGDAMAEEVYREVADAPAREEGVLAELRRVLGDAQASSRRIRRAATAYEPSLGYPGSPLGEALQTVAAMIDARLGTRVFSVELGGFDTHSSQRRRHDGLMRTLDAALAAFLADLDAQGTADDTLVLVFSEFGRRVAENGSQGTDHGVAGPMLVVGKRVKGGLYGAHPSLTELDDGDLVHSTDFRSVYGTVIERWFGVEMEAVLGARYPLIELV